MNLGIPTLLGYIDSLSPSKDSTLTKHRFTRCGKWPSSVVFNLLDNALKYSNTAPLINLDLQEKDNSVQLSVKDNGIGILPDFQKRIFEKFFRVPVGDRHNAKGYGLGLSYVAQVAEKHHGHVEVQSKPGNGATFIIYLPKEQNE